LCSSVSFESKDVTQPLPSKQQHANEAQIDNPPPSSEHTNTRSSTSANSAPSRDHNAGDNGQSGSTNTHSGGSQFLGANQESTRKLGPGSSQSATETRDMRQLITQVECEFNTLLSKLTIDEFDSVSDQIVQRTNELEQRGDGRAAKAAGVAVLVFERAIDSEQSSELYARLCKRMVERLSPDIQDERVRNLEGKLVTGGMLFRNYLIKLCKEGFERGWNAKETVEITSGVNHVPPLGGCSIAAKARRQRLGLFRFIGELFKQRILTENTIQGCIGMLIANGVNPGEGEIESLCKLLTTIGQSFDNPRTQSHMDTCFEQMQKMVDRGNVNSHMRSMLLVGTTSVILCRLLTTISRISLSCVLDDGKLAQ
jgi:translation initiation factor 4G